MKSLDYFVILLLIALFGAGIALAYEKRHNRLAAEAAAKASLTTVAGSKK